MYSYNDVATFVEEEDVKFIRLAFFDINGKQKNVSILSSELDRAFKEGISFDASAIKGFGEESKSDLFLVPEPSTISSLPWRPTRGSVIRMFCEIKRPDNTDFEIDSRYILKKAVEYATSKGITIDFGSEMEFYLFKTDELGNATTIPFDNAGYMAVAPEDKGENVRREICLTLSEMGIHPEASHHELGPGQNEIDFKYSDPLTTADNTATFKWVVRTIAGKDGLFADFSPKPLPNEAGNGMHINISVNSRDGKDYLPQFMAGVLHHMPEMTAFFNSREESYARLGEHKAPKYISWSYENRSQLIRIPAIKGGKKRMELRSPDPSCNQYIAFALLIYAGLDGIENNYEVPEESKENFFNCEEKIKSKFKSLPTSLQEAREIAKDSEFIKKHIPSVYLQEE